ncbi:J domain-containing protein [Halorubellus sp. PRR65]|uniref:J domain-containing protein n=1 Tax=Halorubellus sp. PRR65 TaxID=3098148 RepID=UPI002B25D9B8|nr:J domain-containing protein [Halorubellus sp. PRR65]
MYGVDLFEWVASLPPWVLTGVSLAGAFTVVAACTFAVAEWVFDDLGRAHGSASGASVSSEGRRRVEIREYLDAIEEAFVEDHKLDGEEVAFYLPERDVAVTFDAQAYFRLRATSTTAVLCEHEMHGHHLGGRLPFEVPVVEWYDEDADPEDVVRDAFDVLGLSPSADVDAVRAAYRDRVKEAHPDHGGSEDAFARVREAYATAEAHADPDVDPEGATSTPSTTRSRAP